MKITKPDLNSSTRQLVEAYAAGLNLWCAEKRKRCEQGAAPVSAKDIIAGFVARTPFFYGLDVELRKIFEGELAIAESIDKSRQAFLRVEKHQEIGSNAIAIAPTRSSDGHTRLMVNSHQPYEGPVAWYEARVKSEEGWDMIGGLFPGAPMILHGAGPNLGWAFTVNKPDLVDVFKLSVDKKKNPKRYMFDGEWRELRREQIKFRVKLLGPLSLPVTRQAYFSEHGPVFLTDEGAFAVSYAGANDIRGAEQWFAMNKAQDFDAWRSAMNIGAIPSFNVIYADHTGNIAYFYNAAIPKRKEGLDWKKVQPGDSSDYLWRGREPFEVVPKVVNPDSGFVVNANNTPFESSNVQDSPQQTDFPKTYGIRNKTTNRGTRLLTLIGPDPSITSDELIAYKMDNAYGENSRVMRLVRKLVSDPAAQNDPALVEAIATLKGWDGTVTIDSRGASLAVLTAQKARGQLLNDEEIEVEDYVEALRVTSKALQQGFGRVDPTWGEVVKLKRGDVSVALNGGPDTLRAVYPAGDPADGELYAAGGDTYILYADWAEAGTPPTIKTIHQFGSATLDQSSPHFSDQAPMFAREEWRSPPMTLEALLTEATVDYAPGASDRTPN